MQSKTNQHATVFRYSSAFIIFKCILTGLLPYLEHICIFFRTASSDHDTSSPPVYFIVWRGRGSTRRTGFHSLIDLISFLMLHSRVSLWCFLWIIKARHNKTTLKIDVNISILFYFCYMSHLSPITRKVCLILRFLLHSSILPLLLILKPSLIICFAFVSRQSILFRSLNSISNLE